MKTVQYGDWKIAVDTEKTNKYYADYIQNDSQANRNFAEYCKSLSQEEAAFFDAFGIDPVCCQIEYIGVSKKGDFPCGGYYLVCGEYLEYPPEQVMTIEELAKNDFIDDRPDPRIDIGIFQFDFQCEDYEFKDIPENMPDGFICIRFWCENMKWLLSEKPEERMYELPHFWEIHKIIKEKIYHKKQLALDLEEAKLSFSRLFENLNIKAQPLRKKEIKEFKKEWIAAFSPVDANKKEIKNLCLRSHKHMTYLWHMFSYGFVNCQAAQQANNLFDDETKSNCIIIDNTEHIAYKLKNADNLTASVLEEFVDVTVTADDFSWTYSKTHESMCGPYFYKKIIFFSSFNN